jgi:hypothetical protein
MVLAWWEWFGCFTEAVPVEEMGFRGKRWEDIIFTGTWTQPSTGWFMGFEDGGVVIGDLRGGTGRGGEWDSSSDKTMLGVVFRSFFATEDNTHFRIIEDAGSDEAAPREDPTKREECMLSTDDTSWEAA